MDLPHERFRPGDARPIGFLDDLSPSHIDRTTAAMVEIADAVTMPDSDKPRLSICLTSAGFMPGLPFHLYGFALADTGLDGEVGGDPLSGEMMYAITANQSVDLQRDAAISFFFQLLGRQELVADAMRDRQAFARLVDQSAITDKERARAAGSELRGNWREAVQSLQAQAAAAGFALRVRYQADPFPEHEDVTRRLPALRRAYNSLDVVREAIDRAAAALSGLNWHISGSGDEAARRLVQERLETMQMTRYISQAARDAYVCGNGYLAMSSIEGAPYMRALRPETVRIRDGRYYELIAGEERDVTEGLLHQKGMQQLGSEYGISPVELALSTLRTHDNLEQQVAAAGRFRLSGLPVDQLRQLQESEDVAREALDQSTSRLRTLFEFFLEHLAAPPSDLYFPGQETFSDHPG